MRRSKQGSCPSHKILSFPAEKLIATEEGQVAGGGEKNLNIAAERSCWRELSQMGRILPVGVAIEFWEWY